MNNPVKKLTASEVLDQFFLSSARPDPRVFRELVKQYPEYSDELTRFAVRWGLSDSPDEDTALSEDVSEERLGQFHSRVLQLMWESEKETPISENDSVARAQQALADIKFGGPLEELAKCAHLENRPLLVLKLVMGRIKAPSRKLVDAVASFIGFDYQATLLAMERYSAAGVEISASAKGKPQDEYVKETWDEAVRALEAPEDETNTLLALAVDD